MQSEDITVDEVDVLEPDQLSEDEAREQRELIRAKLDGLGSSLSKYRDEAIAGRSSSGIEAEWHDDEESYEGIDNANRELVNNKPTSPEGGSTAQVKGPARSTVFLNITRPYVDAAAAKVADMLLPSEDANFDLLPTPIPEIGILKNDSTQLVSETSGLPLVKTMPGETEKTPYTVGDKVAALEKKALDAVEKAKKRIRDWQVESRYNDEFRMVVEDAAKIGTGILKGPFPVSIRTKVVSRKSGVIQLIVQDKIQPASKRIDPRNFFPDPSCGDNIHNGNYCWEREEASGRALRDLKDQPGYLADAIDEVLQQGPGAKKADDNGYNTLLQDRDTFELWFYYGFVSVDDLEAAGCDCEGAEPTDAIPAIVVMVNDVVIKAMLSPQETGEFPFDVFVWQRQVRRWAGIGVARQIRTPQRILNSATRNMMDNAGLSAGPQIVVKRGTITPADGVWNITPRKLWFASEEAMEKAVTDAITAINIPSMQVELMGIAQFALKMSEDVTGLPMLLQGQQGKAPDTVGGMQIMMTNASSVLRRLARNADSLLIKPHATRYYEWLLVDPDVPDDEKGDASIFAKGATTLVEREINNQMLAQSLQLSLNPAFGISPERALKEYLTANRFNVSKIELTEQEKAAQAEQAKQQPPDPRIVAAQSSIEVANIRRDTEMQKAQASQAESTIELQQRREEAQFDRDQRMQELQMQMQLEMMRMANAQNISLEAIKAQLADTAMKERNKRGMFETEIAIKQKQGTGI